MSSNPKSVFEAAQQIGKALEGLSPENQQKVLDGAIVMLGLTKSSVSASSDRNSTPAGESGASGGAGTAKPSGKQKSLVEYLNDKGPATNAQRIAVFAAYREEIEKIETFEKDDLEKYFAKAKLAPPGRNFNRDYNNSVTEGWIHDDGASSYLTQTGQKAVTEGFAGKAKPRGPAAAKSPRAKGKP